ncbi:hypothetical protein L873DRAFT_1798657 [Choiromyces venosus 120613-1]|uniref:Uncharacterized protein n=1 Tax=Choiromyces venosus 120613-1 TaxID=1336337 RepID=A0A3N4K3C1_9PEZI|nr:hypothetical protein L873DRAFT_1798657 [Choiromyces venosus 120613-1]
MQYLSTYARNRYFCSNEGAEVFSLRKKKGEKQKLLFGHWRGRVRYVLKLYHAIMV